MASLGGITYVWGMSPRKEIPEYSHGWQETKFGIDAQFCVVSLMFKTCDVKACVADRDIQTLKTVLHVLAKVRDKKSSGYLFSTKHSGQCSVQGPPDKLTFSFNYKRSS